MGGGCEGTVEVGYADNRIMTTLQRIISYAFATLKELLEWGDPYAIKYLHPT
jgi:hypothetical protein